MADVRLTRDFNVTPARLFEVITRQSDLIRWWGHDGMTIPDHALDFSRCGAWHAVMLGADGARYRMSGQVTHVDSLRSVGFTWGWHDDTGARGAESHVTLTVSAAPRGARLTIDHRDLPTAEIAARHEVGWRGPMARLARYLAQTNDPTQQEGTAKMANYLFIYHGGGMPETKEEGEKQMAHWMAWFGDMGDAVVEGGNPVGMSKTVGAKGITDDGGANPTTGYTVVKAGSIEAACEMAKGCPMVVNGTGSVEVAEIIEM